MSEVVKRVARGVLLGLPALLAMGIVAAEIVVYSMYITPIGEQNTWPSRGIVAGTAVLVTAVVVSSIVLLIKVVCSPALYAWCAKLIPRS